MAPSKAYVIMVMICFIDSLQCHQYLSIEELDELKVVHLKRIKDADMKRLKFLEFNGTRYLFIGCSNYIRKYSYNETTGNIEMLGESPALNKLWRANPFPLTYRNTTGYYARNRGMFYKSSYDTCLSFSERSNANSDLSPSDYQKNVDDIGKYPSNSRPKQPWIRFDENFERYHCDNKIHIRGLEKVWRDGRYVLWACGTFSTFPKSFLVDPKTMNIINSAYVDSNVMSCARWADETMVTAPVKNGTELYIGSGWGLYRPSQRNPDVPYNNSTMLYSDWKMLWNGYFWPTRMAMMLGRDVKFIPQYYETKHYLYFFGHEVNPQYSYVNAMTRQAYRSFMIRICKNDTGFNYTASDEADIIGKRRMLNKLSGFWVTETDFPLNGDQTKFSYTSGSWGKAHHFPTKHFTSAIKFPFGCYLKRFDGAQSLNYFWGEQNMLYFNRLADIQMSFNWTDETAYDELRQDRRNKRFRNLYGWKHIHYRTIGFPNLHLYNSMVGAFSSDGIAATRFHNGWQGGTGRMRPSGAVCQFQLGEWKTDHLLHEREPKLPGDHVEDSIFQKKNSPRWQTNFPKNLRQHYLATARLRRYFKDREKPLTFLNRLQEFYALYGTMQDSFYTRQTKWFEGMQPNNYFGVDFMAFPKLSEEAYTYLRNATDCGRCRTQEEIASLSKKDFEILMNHSSTAWPTDWLSYLTKYYDAYFHMNPMAVAGDNASFYMEGVEFMKMLVLEKNFTKYKGGNISQPLLHLLLVSTEGDVYRVAMCDLVSYPINLTTCEVRNTDQPYVNFVTTAVRANLVDNENHHIYDSRSRHGRVSSLLSKWRLASADDYKEYPNRLDPQSPIVKDAQYDEKSKRLLLITNAKLVHFSLTPEHICSTYRTCIECASDPFCGWNHKGRFIGHGNCQVYQNFHKELIQDVLGRGEKCYKNSKKTVAGCNIVLKTDLDPTVLLKCNASTLFRGRIFWRSKQTNEEFHPDEVEQFVNQRFAFGPDSSLIIFKHNENFLKNETYDCIGIPIDGDKETILETQIVLHQELSTKAFIGEVIENSYCPCIKALMERLPRNTEVESVYVGSCNN